MRTILTTVFAGVLAMSGALVADVESEKDVLLEKSHITRPGMHEDMAKALNDQLRIEMESAYLYMGISTYFAEQGLEGFAHWFSLHANEELEHAMKVHKFLLDRGVAVSLPDLSAPSTVWESPVQALEDSLLHEISVSQTIKNEYELAQELKEYDAGEFVLWFLREQVEEENLFESVLNKLYLIEDSHPAALMLLDLEMGKRQS